MLDSIICLVEWAVHAVGQTMLTVVDFILSALIIAVNAIVYFLPSDPLEDPAGPPSGALGLLNYIIPLDIIVGQFSLLMIAWILYRVYAWLLRWAKAEG